MSKQTAFAAKTAYEQALAQYEAFRAEHADVFEEHDHLAVALQEAFDAMKNEYKENHKILGRQFAGMKLSVPRELKVDVLIEELGEDEVEKFSFVKKKLSIDAKEWDKAVSAGVIDRSLAEKVEGEGSPRITGGPRSLPTIYQP
jgi:hypothetical protein